MFAVGGRRHFTMEANLPAMATRPAPAYLEVAARFLRLGLTSFGGPVAHLGYFRREFVERARWLDDASFGEMIALCSALPGPSSSQVGILLGTLRAGPAGGLIAWLCFTAPSALALALFGMGLRAAHAHGGQLPAAAAGALTGLQGAASAVVVLAVRGMFRTLTRTTATRAIAATAFALSLASILYAPMLQWIPLLAGGLAGAAFPRLAPPLPAQAPPLRVPRAAGVVAACALLLALFGLPLVAAGGYATLFATFFRAGSLVFGGGHVVLPFLQALIGPQRVDVRDFFAGYGAAQAVPGPLFTFAAFLGAADKTIASPALGALVATLGIFAPSFLLLPAGVALWGSIRRFARAPAILMGLNAAVVGLLAAVAVDPIGVALVRVPLAAAIALCALIALVRFALPAWLVVLGSALAGAVLGSVLPR
jgi:chromate transporter